MAESIVLLSGGIESTTLLHQERQRHAPVGLFVDYGQRGAARERRAAQTQCDRLGVVLRELNMGTVGEAFREGLDRRLHVPLPHRNLVVLSLGLSFADNHGARRLALALNREDADSYASASNDFLEGFRTLARTLSPIEIATPLIALSKAEVIVLGTALGVGFADTYSCLLGYPQHCGSCPQCLKRRAAFEAAGQRDPTVYRRD
ncbi:MAG: 7-cyano-7-deazaguanine synthase [Gammaproteobacteria bacterium]